MIFGAPMSATKDRSPKKGHDLAMQGYLSPQSIGVLARGTAEVPNPSVHLSYDQHF